MDLGTIGILLTLVGVILLLAFIVSVIISKPPEQTRSVPVIYYPPQPPPQRYAQYSAPVVFKEEPVKDKPVRSEIVETFRRHPVLLIVGVIVLFAIFGRKLYRLARQAFAFVRYAMDEEARLKIFNKQ